MVAAQSFSSSYHFQRVFSILCGFTIGEYIRNRRLSLAGTELTTSDAKVIDVALKYGYESPDSFAKAFQKFHGILPSQARNDGSNLKTFSRLVLKFSLEGGSIMNYRIEEKEEITLIGHVKTCSGSPTNIDNTHMETREHWISTRNYQQRLKALREGDAIWYDVYSDFIYDEFTHMIAVESHCMSVDADLKIVKIPKHKYAIFETKRCESPDDEWATLMKKIISEWMSNSNYVLADHPQINKQYFAANYDKRYIEVWIPIEKK